MENLIQEVDGIKYVLIRYDIGATENGKQQVIKLDKKLKRFKGIEVSCEYVNSFWGTSKFIIKILIPESRAVEFSQTNFSGE